MTVETEMQRKQVTIAELQAEADKVQKVKQAEADAQSKVVEAKGESDAMQYTLPLKEKQIEQTQAGGGGAQGVDDQECGGARRGQGDRQQGRTAAPQYAGGC